MNRKDRITILKSPYPMDVSDATREQLNDYFRRRPISQTTMIPAYLQSLAERTVQKLPEEYAQYRAEALQALLANFGATEETIIPQLKLPDGMEIQARWVRRVSETKVPFVKPLDPHIYWLCSVWVGRTARAACVEEAKVEGFYSP